ncbi:MAG TPA: ABC transporter transmembrane domain-containing protein, partial [Mycobacteriales bacterium]|nr:ABC transporter transmembrane domain-containing protein [Mycobacteriales bacterium]
MAESRSEFTVADQYRYDRSSPVRWLLSHQRRNRRHVVGFLGGSLVMVVLNTAVPSITGKAFDTVLGHGDRSGRLLVIVLVLLVIVLLRGAFDILARLCAAVLAMRLERDARDELYVSLLGKSQTFHNRQRVGDLMARAANDVRQLNGMILPGIDLVVDSMLQGIVPFVFIALIAWRLLLSPGLLAVGFVITVRHYMKRLGPVSTQ